MENIYSKQKSQNKLEKLFWQILNLVDRIKKLESKSHFTFVVILPLLLVSCGGNEKSTEIIDIMPKTIDSFKSFAFVYIAFKFYSILIEFIIRIIWEIKITMFVNIAILVTFYIVNNYSILILLLMYGIDFVFGFIYYYLRNRKSVGL